MIDANTVDSKEHSSLVDLKDENFDREEFSYLNDSIKNQYIELNNIGTNLIKDIETNYLIPIFEEMIEYIDENYVSILIADDAKISPIQLVEFGKIIYEFFVIDCLNTIIPNYMNSIGRINIDDFDVYYSTVLKNDQSNFKTSFIKTITSILDELLKFQKLDGSIINNKEYNYLLKKYTYYIELINFGNSENFLENYFRKILTIYEDDIRWRII